jgi:transposase InsO family protein
MMAISESTYYADPKVTRAEQEEWEADIRGRIEQIRITFANAGYRMLLNYLKRDGIEIGERKLRGLMKKHQLHITPKRRYVHTTDSKHGKKVYPNLIKGKELDGLNQVWASDFTYIRINNGFVYLAVILDLYSRKVIGWGLSKRIDAKLAVSALAMAIARRSPSEGVIHHSDRGVQYLSDEYTLLLKANGFIISCSAKGNPYDNAFVESFMKTLKTDEVELRKYETYLDVIENVPGFIEEVYNKKRLHSGLDYCPPEEYEEKITKGTSRAKLKL